MKVEASVPAYLPTSTQQKYVKTTVVPQQDGSHKVNQVHYLTTVYDQLNISLIQNVKDATVID